MEKRAFRKAASLLLCLAMILSLCPWAAAVDGMGPGYENPDRQADGDIELALFTGTSKEDITPRYTVTFTEDETDRDPNYPVDASYDRGICYLQTGSMPEGHAVEVSGIENVPYGTYRMDLLYKIFDDGRATVQCHWDGQPVGEAVDLGSSEEPARSQPQGDFLHTDGTGQNNSNLYAVTLSEALEVTGNEADSHTLRLEVLEKGVCAVYGLLLTPVGEPVIRLDQERVDLEQIQPEPVVITA